MHILTCHITWTVSCATIKPKFRNLQVIEANQHFLLHSGGKEIVFLSRLQRFGLIERDHPKQRTSWFDRSSSSFRSWPSVNRTWHLVNTPTQFTYPECTWIPIHIAHLRRNTYKQDTFFNLTYSTLEVLYCTYYTVLEYIYAYITQKNIRDTVLYKQGLVITGSNKGYLVS